MGKINYTIKRQEDGWYLATADLASGSIIVEGEDYASLKQRILDFTRDHLEFCRQKNIPAPRNPQIRLVYSELLFENPNAERILVAGNPESNGYRARSNTYVNIDLNHLNLEELKKLISQNIRDQGHHDKHVEFRLEEIL